MLKDSKDLGLALFICFTIGGLYAFSVWPRQTEFVGPPDPAIAIMPEDGNVNRIYFHKQPCELDPPRKVKKGEKLNLRELWRFRCEISGP